MSCWTCPLCPLIFKRRYNFDQHPTSSHQLQPGEVTNTWQSLLPKQQILVIQRRGKVFSLKKKPPDKAFSVIKSEKEEPRPSETVFDPGAFSSTFCCSFCNENFDCDSKLVLHLQLNHGDEEKSELQQVLEDVKHFRLDGCAYQCQICRSKATHSNIYRCHCCFISK